MSTLHCYRCGSPNEWNAQRTIGRRDTCAKCGNDLHVCRNCEHYDVNAHWECREHITEAVREKEKSNFCDFYSPSGSARVAASDNKEDLLKKAEALFKKG